MHSRLRSRCWIGAALASVTVAAGCASEAADESAHASSSASPQPSSPTAVGSLDAPLPSLQACGTSAYSAAFTGTLAEPVEPVEPGGSGRSGGDAVFGITADGAIDQIATIDPATGNSEILKMEMARDAASAYVLTTTLEGAQDKTAPENSLLNVDLTDGSIHELAQFDLADHFTVLSDGHILLAGLEPGSHTADGSYDGGPPLSRISFKINPDNGHVTPYEPIIGPPNGLTASPVEPVVISSLWMDDHSGLVGPLLRLNVSTSVDELLYPEPAGTPPGEFQLDNQHYRYHASDVSPDGSRTLVYGEPFTGPNGASPAIFEIDVHTGALLSTSPIGDINPWVMQLRPALVYTAADTNTAATVITGPDGASLHTYARQADGTWAATGQPLPLASAYYLDIAPCALSTN